MMDLKFDWQKITLTDVLPVYHGKVVLTAVVRMAGYEIECRVRPGSHGDYGWEFYPQIPLPCGCWIFLNRSHRIARSNGFKEPIEAMANLEKVLRSQIERHFAGQPSIVDDWWPAIVRRIREQTWI